MDLPGNASYKGGDPAFPKQFDFSSIPDGEGSTAEGVVAWVPADLPLTAQDVYVALLQNAPVEWIDDQVSSVVMEVMATQVREAKKGEEAKSRFIFILLSIQCSEMSVLCY